MSERDLPDTIGFASNLSAIERLWEAGLPPGDKAGWPSIDKHYTIAPGQVTVITGWPSAGKSDFLDALLVNLMHQGWRHAIYSPENQPVELHQAKILEKVSGKPFGRGPSERLSIEEVRDISVQMLAGRFQFIPVSEDGALTAAGVIKIAQPWLDKFKGKKRSLIIDPWNELEHSRPRGLSETEYVSQTLSMVRNWARPSGVHVFIVAHPQKMKRENGKLPVPTLDMISGSQHWWNKADCGLTVWRDPEQPESPEVDIHIQKIRFKHIGRPGMVTLRYDRVSGRYNETPANMREYRRAKDGE